jgi:hypothetical protein
VVKLLRLWLLCCKVAKLNPTLTVFWDCVHLRKTLRIKEDVGEELKDISVTTSFFMMVYLIEISTVILEMKSHISFAEGGMSLLLVFSVGNQFQHSPFNVWKRISFRFLDKRGLLRCRVNSEDLRERLAISFGKKFIKSSKFLFFSREKRSDR